MNLSEALQKKKKKILEVWVERTLDTYKSSSFFKKSTDRIANPTGMTIRNGLAQILDLLLQDAEPEKYLPALDQVVRIRAIQEFIPSQAVVPFLELKWIIRQILLADGKTESLVGQLAPLDCEIDKIALAAFDIYTECREQLYKVRIQELKSGNYILSDSPCISSQLRERQKSK
jgi:hypothetical protein